MCVAGAVVALLGLSASFSYSIISRIKLDGDVAVTAHRGSSRAAPENTLAAILQAMEDGADVAEIDVQQTADGAVVLLHDTDLRRVAGVNRRISDMTYGELKELDVGSWFSAEFAQERIPTLEEALDAARGRIKLNIELKVSRNDRRLPAEVARLVRQADLEHECVVTSLSYDAVRQIAQQYDQLRTGLIIAARVGDVASLEVDILAVSAKLVTRDLVARAHRAGKEIHVWTVNDPRQMLTMIHLGVDNILTSTPQVLVELRSDWRQMSDAEKSLLFVSDFLAGRL
jgi:glycerophosphoryl diester phosphodiesterase